MSVLVEWRPMDSESLMSRVKFDPTINLGHIASAAVGVLCVLAAWYQLSGKVETNQEVNKVRFDAIASTMMAQDIKNKEQDLAIKELGVELKSEMRSNTQEIKQELRDSRRR